MVFHSWLQNLRSALAPHRGQGRHQRRGPLRATPHRLNLEVLEDRLTPSFYWGGVYSAAEFYEMAPAGFNSSPSSVSADFNGDGWLDVVRLEGAPAASDWSAIKSIFMGRGDGTFVLWARSALGGDPRWVGTGDFNADGLPDQFTYYFDDDSVLVGLNDGNWAQNLSVSDAAVVEGNTGTANATFTLTLSYVFNVDLTVHYEIADITATGGSDYVAASGDVIVPAGQTGATFTVPVIGDHLPEPNETFALNLTFATYVGIGTGRGIGTILDDEPHLSVSDATVTEGNTGTANATFTVSLSAAATEPVTVAYATADGTATAGSDYQAASGTLTFAPGETTNTITILVNGDRLFEPNKTFYVNLSGATSAVIHHGFSVGTIVDDEPRISISDVTRYEGNGNKTTLFVFTVTLSAAYDQAVTMSYRTADGTATTGDSDYIAKTGTLTFAPGETSKTITIEVKRDRKSEANETFYLELFDNSSNSLFTKSRGIGRIWNDD